MSSSFLQLGYTLNTSSGVWHKENNADFDYCDGPSEQVLYDQIKLVRDLSCGSDEVRRHMVDWPSRYHLSPARADLLRPLQQTLHGRVLEIGAGCGAITRYLGENSQSVVAVEGAAFRAKIARERCRDLPNVEVICDNAIHFTSDEKFDAVTLIGVLEYSRKYITAADPVGTLLAHCRALLKPQGVLIVAIENQLGLKYFAGAPEDHVGEAFFGINDLYSDNTVVTFGKKDLGRKLHKAGFLGVDFLYPFPDYKHPKVILTEEGTQASGDILKNISCRLGAPNQSHNYIRLFSEEIFSQVAARNGLLGDLANSFLVCARPQPVVDEKSKEELDLAYIYSTDQDKQFAKETILYQAEDTGVRRRRLYPQLPSSKGSLSQHLCHKRIIAGSLYSTELHKIVNTPGWNLASVAAWAQPWVDFLRTHATASGSKDLPNLPGSMADCIPFNVVRDQNGHFETFDLEWHVSSDIPLAWVVFRGIFHTLCTLKSTAVPAPSTPLQAAGIAAAVLTLVDLAVSSQEVLTLWRLESLFFNATPHFTSIHINARHPQGPIVQPPKALENLATQAENSSFTVQPLSKLPINLNHTFSLGAPQSDNAAHEDLVLWDTEGPTKSSPTAN